MKHYHEMQQLLTQNVTALKYLRDWELRLAIKCKLSGGYKNSLFISDIFFRIKTVYKAVDRCFTN